MSAFKRRTLAPPLIGIGGHRPSPPRSSAFELPGDGGPVRESVRRLGDTARSWSLWTNSCSSTVDGSPRADSTRRASSASRRWICSPIAASNASCSASSASRMPSATPLSSSTPSCRPKGSGGKPVRGSGVLHPLTPLDEEGRVEGVAGGLNRSSDFELLWLESLHSRNSRHRWSLSSWIRSSKTCPHDSACDLTSSRIICACRRRRSRC
mmetsp:Transcript_58437/g.187668  ORF Transcript_58437/g.187668 Transcript_58437/m.187668 type:complete len:210 (-) Transcript_58437:388-1017(-)